MVWKLVITALMIFCIAQSSTDGRLSTEAGALIKIAPERQFIDAELAPATTFPEIPDGARTLTPMPLEEPLSPYDLDIPTQTVAFGAAEIDQLIVRGEVDFALPGHARITLQLLGLTEKHGMQHIRAKALDNVTTITRRGHTFFATLALPTGSFRLEGQGASAQIYPHQLIAARSIRHEADYRHVH